MGTTIGWVIKGENVVTIDGTDITVLDGMLDAQNALGQITWTDLTTTVARGTYVPAGVIPVSADELHRIAVIDLDNADVAEALAATLWVNE